MTTITLEVPDYLATRIESLREQLPSLLATVFGTSSAEKTSQALIAAATHPVYREMLDFLATSPSPRQIIEFKASIFP